MTMASTQGIRAGRAFVELFADTSALVRGLRAAEKKLQAFGDSVKTIGVTMAGTGSAILAPLVSATAVFSTFGDDLAKMSARTGVTVESLSTLKYAAAQSGVEMTALETSLRRMQKTVVEAGSGSKSAQDALALLGVSARQLQTLSPDEQFKVLADRLAAIDDPAKKATAAMAIFGKAGTQLLPMCADGAQGIADLQAEARRLGLVMSTADAKAAEVFGDTLDRLWSVVQMGTVRVGAALAPVLQSLAETFTEIAVAASTWIDQNREWVVIVAEVAAAVAAGGLVLAGLGVVIATVGQGFGVLASMVSGTGSLLKILVPIVTSLVSPVGLVIAAVTALGGVLLVTSGAGAKAIAWLADKFAVLKADALSAFGGISDALAAGDMTLAAKILWLTLKMEWTRGVAALESAWLSFRNMFLRVGIDAWSGVLAVAETVGHALEVGWIETTAFLGDVWSGFVSLFAHTWEDLKAIASKAWTWIKGLFDDSTAESRDNAYAKIDRQRDDAVAQVDNTQQQKIAARDADRQRRRDQASKEHSATLAQIGASNLDAHAQLDADTASRLAENEAELAAARKDWQEALTLAKQKRSAGSADSPVADAASSLSGLGDVDAMIRAVHTSVVGSFDVTNLRGLSAATSTFESMNDHLATIAKNTDPHRAAGPDLGIR